MRIVIMGTGPFAVPACERLLADGHDIPLVVTRPQADPQAKRQPPRPVFQWASDAGIDVFEPQSINTPDAIAEVRRYQPELLFVCDYGQILSREALAAAPLGGMNLHGSILPRHRGAAPVQWTLLRGDAEAGVTVIHMTARLDAGPALAVQRTPVEPDETAAELEPRLAVLGVDATVDAIRRLDGWDRESLLGDLQDKALVTKAPRFSKSDGQLDFRLPAEYLVRLVRACQPWPGTFAELQWPGGKKMRILIPAARCLAGPLPENLLPAREPSAGTALAMDAQDLGQDWSAPWAKMLAVVTGDGVLLAGRVQPAGKRAMDAEEFFRGHPIEGSAQFLLPPEPASPLA